MIAIATVSFGVILGTDFILGFLGKTEVKHDIVTLMGNKKWKAVCEYV